MDSKRADELPDAPATPGGAGEVGADGGEAPGSGTVEDREAEARRRRRLRRERGRKWKRLRRAIVVSIALPPVIVLSWLPLSVARGIARVLGNLGWLLAGGERRKVTRNLREAFGGELDERAIRRLSRRVFVHTALSFADAMVLRRWSRERLERRFELSRGFEGAPPFDGAVGIAAHFGNWELLAFAFARYRPGVLVPIATRNPNETLQRHIERFREKIGLEVIYTDESPRRMFRALREGKMLGFLPDQDLKIPNGIFVDFFGRPAYTTTAPVTIAKGTDRDIVFGVLVREGSGFRVIFRAIELEWTGDRARDLETNTRRWTAVLEEEIRKRPEQWMWFHDRWRTQPGDKKRRHEFRRRRRRR